MEDRPVDIMRERILPTTFAAALFLSVAVFEVGPLAAPKNTTQKSAAPRVAAKGSTPFAGRARYEPMRGAYLGAALDYSKIEGEGEARMGAIADVMGAWEKESGRENALYMQFNPFPHADGSFPSWDKDPKGWASIADFCNASDALGAAPVLTLEPLQPRVFVDGWKEGQNAFEATRALAMKMGAWNKPAFVRFAHEMNGSWYPWAEWEDKNRNQKRDPDEDTGFTASDYRKAFRNAASLFRKYAPNVALVWCPNSGLLGGEKRDVFGPFYPGDDVVDWVGLDIYERGWTMPKPGAKLWGGQFAYNLTRDMNDDLKTPNKNESINFYETYAVGKNKPLMLCETGATLSFRDDLENVERAWLNHQWKAGYWNDAEYGWMQAVYGTSAFKEQHLLQPIDRAFPKIKALVWFQVGKREYIPVEKSPGKIIWYEDKWADYRMGGAVEEGAAKSEYADLELDLFRRLTNTPYYLSKIAK